MLVLSLILYRESCQIFLSSTFRNFYNISRFSKIGFDKFSLFGWFFVGIKCRRKVLIVGRNYHVCKTVERGFIIKALRSTTNLIAAKRRSTSRRHCESCSIRLNLSKWRESLPAKVFMTNMFQEKSKQKSSFLHVTCHWNHLKQSILNVIWDSILKPSESRKWDRKCLFFLLKMQNCVLRWKCLFWDEKMVLHLSSQACPCGQSEASRLDLKHGALSAPTHTKRSVNGSRSSNVKRSPRAELREHRVYDWVAELSSVCPI